MAEGKDLTKGQATSFRVQQAAFKLFTTQGYHGTSMRQIAQEAGLTAASIYNHFKNKEQIFQQVLKAHHPYHQILPILETAKGETVEALVRDVARRSFAIIRKRKELLHLLFIEAVEFEGKHLGAIFAAFSPRVFIFLDQLERGQLRRVGKADVLMSLVGLVLSQWIIQSVFLKNIKLPVAPNHFDAALDIFLHGILKPQETNA